MNYKRIEWIFLIAFVLLNGYLISILYANNKAASQVTTENNKQIETIMQRDNIRYRHKLSSKQQEGYYISADITNLADKKKTAKEAEVQVRDNALIGTLKSPFEVAKQEAEESLAHFLKDNIVYGTEYTYLPEASKGNKALVCAQSYHGIPIYDMSAEVIFTKEKTKENQTKVISYQQRHVQDIKPMRDASPLISERDAVYTLYTNSRLSSGDVIEWIRLAYAKVLTRGQTVVYVPTWIVSVKSNNGVTEVEKVNAISNRIMNANSMNGGTETSE